MLSFFHAGEQLANIVRDDRVVGGVFYLDSEDEPVKVSKY